MRSSRHRLPRILTLLALASLGVPHPSAAATTFETLHNYGLGIAGSIPVGGVVLSGSKTLYGTTDAGGAPGYGGYGVVFELTQGAGTTHWTETVLHRFQGIDGRNPQTTMLRDPAGALYGATYYGGTNDLGVVYKLTPPASSQGKWTFEVLHSFTGIDGENPVGSLARDKSGAIYGVTYGGGKNFAGNIFKLTPPAAGSTKWAAETIFSFDGYNTGDFPAAGLVISPAGALYGTATSNGPNSLGSGVVYELTPPAAGKTAWTYSVLHVFGLSESDGYAPQSELVLDSAGTVYGTTAGGGAPPPSGTASGTIFKLSPPLKGKTGWAETILYTFTGETDGGAPATGLILDKTGALYGTNDLGGAQQDGNIFRLTPPGSGAGSWVFRNVLSFTGGDGGAPAAGLALSADGALLGTTTEGGSGGEGTVFRLVP
jgi:uncharacterized repeat protein (TIGR03803 family)